MVQCPLLSTYICTVCTVCMVFLVSFFLPSVWENKFMKYVQHGWEFRYVCMCISFLICLGVYVCVHVCMRVYVQVSRRSRCRQQPDRRPFRVHGVQGQEDHVPCVYPPAARPWRHPICEHVRKTCMHPYM